MISDRAFLQHRRILHAEMIDLGVDGHHELGPRRRVVPERVPGSAFLSDILDVHVHQGEPRKYPNLSCWRVAVGDPTKVGDLKERALGVGTPSCRHVWP